MSDRDLSGRSTRGYHPPVRNFKVKMKAKNSNDDVIVVLVGLHFSVVFGMVILLCEGGGGLVGYIIEL